jgi:hypothetical protein
MLPHPEENKYQTNSNYCVISGGASLERENIKTWKEIRERKNVPLSESTEF